MKNLLKKLFGSPCPMEERTEAILSEMEKVINEYQASGRDSVVNFYHEQNKHAFKMMQMYKEILDTGDNTALFEEIEKYRSQHTKEYEKRVELEAKLRQITTALDGVKVA